MATYTPTPVQVSARGRGEVTPTPTPFPTQTPTPTATPSPTPTLAPTAQLERARRLHQFGDYGSEQVLLRLFLDGELGTPEQRLEARYRLALAYLADERFQDALAQLDQFRQEAQAQDLPLDEPRWVASSFLQGDALAGLGRYTEAIAAYWAFLEQQPELAEVVQEAIGDAYLALGRLEDAALAYRRAADATPERVRRVQRLEKLANVHLQAGAYQEAVAVYDEILGQSRNAPYRAGLLHRAGNALAQLGDEEGAIQRWRRAIGEDPASPSAYQALIELVNREAPVDNYLRGYVDLKARAYLPAINAFQLVLQEADADAERRGQALLGLGQAYAGLENYAAALENLDRLIGEIPACTCFGQAWLEKAQVLEKQGDGVAARRLYRTFAREFPQDKLAPEALWRSALSAIRSGEELEAATDLLALADTFPQSSQAAAARYMAGLGFFMRGIYGAAQEQMAKLQEAVGVAGNPGATYWLGRSLLSGGQPQEAQQQWQQLREADPDGYYGILAAQALAQPERIGQDLLSGVAAIAGPGSTLDGDDGSRAFAEAWLGQWLGSGDLGSKAVWEDADFQAGQLLLELERREDALIHLDRVRQRYSRNPRALYALSLAFQDLGVYRLSIGSADQLIRLSPAQRVEDAPIFLQRILYPRHFAELVEGEARAQGIEPLVLYSLIRQESLFESGARSVAAAQGLAQIIPDTGQWIAERLGFANYRNELVYRPHINVKFGAYYLAWARDYLDGSLVAAVVGYNAGPGNAKFWREVSGPDDTLFVEVITLQEPRIYIQRITSHLYHYSRLYPELRP